MNNKFEKEIEVKKETTVTIPLKYYNACCTIIAEAEIRDEDGHILEKGIDDHQFQQTLELDDLKGKLTDKNLFDAIDLDWQVEDFENYGIFIEKVYGLTVSLYGIYGDTNYEVPLYERNYGDVDLEILKNGVATDEDEDEGLKVIGYNTRVELICEDSDGMKIMVSENSIIGYNDIPEYEEIIEDARLDECVTDYEVDTNTPISRVVSGTFEVRKVYENNNIGYNPVKEYELDESLIETLNECLRLAKEEQDD